MAAAFNDLEDIQPQRSRESKEPSSFQLLRGCCCHYAPTVIVLDLVLILILIGEIVLVVPDRKVLIVTTESKEDKSYGLEPELGNQGVKGMEYYLWSGSCYSVFTIPVNTSLIAFGLRLIFCKIHTELLKPLLVMVLLGVYLSTLLGLIGYIMSTQDSELFKQSFFLQYIILAVSLVLGFLT
jgi:hypothetical protein